MSDALATVWTCCTLAILIMFTRLVMGRYCKSKWDAGDSLTVVAIVLSIARIAFTHITIVFKTNNVDDIFRETHAFTEQEIHMREFGAKSTLVARCLYICLLWIQKLVLLMFYRHLVRDMPWGGPTMRVYGLVFAITWAVSIIFTFVECRPFHLYWQVLPDPGNCTQAITQLYVVGITNIFTDLMLIGLPIPVILKVRLSLTKKLQLAFLFSVGFMIIIVTAIRIPFTVQSRSSETIRITWTTGEFLAATFVANAPKLYSFRHLVQRRNSGPIRRFSRSGVGGRGGVGGGNMNGREGRGSRPTDDLEDTAFSITEVATGRFKEPDMDPSTSESERGRNDSRVGEGQIVEVKTDAEDEELGPTDLPRSRNVLS